MEEIREVLKNAIVENNFVVIMEFESVGSVLLNKSFVNADSAYCYADELTKNNPQIETFVVERLDSMLLNHGELLNGVVDEIINKIADAARKQ